jgi:hypothetical protein
LPRRPGFGFGQRGRPARLHHLHDGEADAGEDAEAEPDAERPADHVVALPLWLDARERGCDDAIDMSPLSTILLLT